MTAIDVAARRVVLKNDAGETIGVLADDKTSYLRAQPGARDLSGAAAIALGDVAVGDRLLARGTLSGDLKTLTARQIVVMTKADITQKQEREREEWRRRGVAGVVTALDPAKAEVTVEVRSLAGPQPLVIDTAERKAGFRRYAPDSVKFADAQASSFSELKPGDQIRALGERTPEGARFLAEQVVSGAFRIVSGAVKGVGGDGRELTITDNESHKTLTVAVGPDAMLRRLPPEMAMRLAARARAAGAPSGRAGPAGSRPEAGEAPGPGGGRRSGPATLQDMLERLPPIAALELKPGDQVAVSSTAGADPARLTAVVLLAGIEPLLEARPARTGGPDVSPGLPPGALDLGMGVP